MSDVSLIAGRWYWWAHELVKIVDAKTGACENMRGMRATATIDGFREVTADDLDAYQDEVLSRASEPGRLSIWYANIANRLDEVRRDNGLTPYQDRRLMRALTKLGSEYEPRDGWQDDVLMHANPKETT